MDSFEFVSCDLEAEAEAGEDDESSEGIESWSILLMCCFSKETEAETPADRLRIAILGERGRRG